MSFRGSCDFRVVMDAQDVSTDQSFETEAHSKKGARDDKVSGASEETQMCRSHTLPETVITDMLRMILSQKRCGLKM